MYRFLQLTTLSFALAITGACAHATIEGTNIRETPDTREIYDMIVKVRQSLQSRDADALIGMVSKQYFEDCGTPDPSDDYGYYELKERIAKDSLQSAKEVFVNYQVFEIVVGEAEAHADLRYNSRTRLELPSGQLWDTHRDFDRVEFIREDGHWRIVSGL